MRPRLLLLIASLGASLAAPSGASSLRLSAGASFSDVSIPAFSSDGSRAVFLQNAERDGVVELWSVPITGGAVIRLNAPLAGNESVFIFRMTSNGDRVVYLAGDNGFLTVNLFSASVNGPPGAGLQLNGALGMGEVVHELEISADSARVVFAVSQDLSTSKALWSAALDGSDLEPLVTLPAGREIDSFRISQDSTQVLYVAEAASGARELWRVSIVGGAAQLLSSGLPATASVTGFDVSPDSTTVVYAANRDAVDRFELFRVAPGDVAPVQITPEVAVSERAGYPRFAPDGTRVLYINRNSGSGARALWSIEPDGDGNIRLDSVPPGGRLLDDAAFRITGDSQRVVFLADPQPGQFELFSAPLAGGDATRLNGPLQPDGDVSSDFVIAASGQRVVYRAGEVIANRSDLYSVPTVGGQGTRLTPEFEVCFTGIPQIDQLRFTVSADGRRVFFSQCIDPLLPGDMGIRLWTVPALGGPSERVDSCEPGEDVNIRLAVSPTRAHHVLYVADEHSDEQFDLHLGDALCRFCDGFEAIPR